MPSSSSRLPLGHLGLPHALAQAPVRRRRCLRLSLVTLNVANFQRGEVQRQCLRLPHAFLAPLLTSLPLMLVAVWRAVLCWRCWRPWLSLLVLPLLLLLILLLLLLLLLPLLLQLLLLLLWQLTSL